MEPLCGMVEPPVAIDDDCSITGTCLPPVQSCEVTGTCPARPAQPEVVCIPDELVGICCDWADDSVNEDVAASTIPAGGHKELELKANLHRKIALIGENES